MRPKPDQRYINTSTTLLQHQHTSSHNQPATGFKLHSHLRIGKYIALQRSWRRLQSNMDDDLGSLTPPTASRATHIKWTEISINDIMISCTMQYHPPWRTGGDHQDALVLRGWRLSSRAWNQTTYTWMKQLMWLRTVHSGDWCLRLALHISSGACQKRKKRKWPTSHNTSRSIRPYRECCYVKPLHPHLMMQDGNDSLGHTYNKLLTSVIEW